MLIFFWAVTTSESLAEELSPSRLNPLPIARVYEQQNKRKGWKSSEEILESPAGTLDQPPARHKIQSVASIPPANATIFLSNETKW